jgi:16S rRNA (cytosine967-C5)-methyltransferase
MREYGDRDVLKRKPELTLAEVEAHLACYTPFFHTATAALAQLPPASNIAAHIRRLSRLQTFATGAPWPSASGRAKQALRGFANAMLLRSLRSSRIFIRKPVPTFRKSCLERRMTPSARVQAALEALADIESRRRPAADALKDWGLAHRFAGAGDRAAIASLVYDALRRRASSSWRFGEDSPRAHVMGALSSLRGLGPEEIAALFSGEKHAPAPLTEAERERLAAAALHGAPDFVRGDYPEWLAPAFAESFGEQAAAAGAALATRAPVDLRVNTLKTNRDKILSALAHLNPEPTPLSPIGVRIAVRPDGRGPPLAAEPAYAKGQVEVQDEASQLAALLSGASPGQQALDLCAGAGGKTLALAAMLANKGQVYATDEDGRRLAPLYARLERSGARNVQVRAPRGAADPVADLEARCDLVFLDAPCTGSGAWRRNPDAKWRIRPGALEERMKDQAQILERAAKFVKHGGRLVYVTCSVLKPENEDRIAAFLSAHPDFLPLDAGAMARGAGLPALAEFASKLGPGIRLDPLHSGTDGFYIAGLART